MVNGSVAICVATYKRPEGLARLLKSIQTLESGNLSLHLIVADNDPEGSGREVFDAYTQGLTFPATYVIESARGLSAVRNRLVAESNSIGAEFIASVDDDQTVDAMWVVELVNAALEHNASAVAPNLQYSFPPNTSRAIQYCFNSPKLSVPVGTTIRAAGTNGSLFRAKAINRIPGPFDLRLNLTGGEDSMLSLRIRNNGGTIIRSNTAIATEHIPATRTNFRWIANRAWWEGQSRTREIKWVNPSWKKSTVHTGLFLGYAAKNLLMIIPDLLKFRVLPLRRVRLVIFGISGVKHMILDGGSIEAYATTDGS